MGPSPRGADIDERRELGLVDAIVDLGQHDDRRLEALVPMDRRHAHLVTLRRRRQH
jgi:hypothetical protein